VTQGVAENEVADEQRTPRPDLTEVRVILESRSGDGVTAATGWMRKVGKDRVAYLANHHTRDALGQPTFRLLVANAMRWSLRREQ
jgi:type 1 glutamine amidotransferase